MRKIVVLLVVLLAIPESLLADDTQRLVVWMKGQQKVYINLTEEPETTFEGAYLVIKTKSTSYSYLMENVLRYTYEGVMTSIAIPRLQEGEMMVSQGADHLTFDGLPEGTLLQLYSMDGKKLSTLHAVNGQSTVVSLKGYPSGVYIVKIDDTSYKFVKR